MSRREIVLGLLVVALSWALALFCTHGQRPPAGAGCALDRVPIKPEYAVRAALADGTSLSFCNVICALAYLRDSGAAGVTVTVTDESTGAPLDPLEAFYVESEVFTHRESGNRIHVFAARTDAEKHASLYGGRVLACPFPAR